MRWFARHARDCRCSTTRSCSIRFPFRRRKSPLVGDLADDIADIFSDVLTGLKCFDDGRMADAAWEWAFSFQTHWGRHASGAIRTLHAYLADATGRVFTPGRLFAP